MAMVLGLEVSGQRAKRSRVDNSLSPWWLELLGNPTVTNDANRCHQSSNPNHSQRRMIVFLSPTLLALGFQLQLAKLSLLSESGVGFRIKTDDGRV